MSLPEKRKTLGRRLAVPPLPAGVAKCRRGKAWGDIAWEDKGLESQGGEKEQEGSYHPCSVTALTTWDLGPFP